MTNPLGSTALVTAKQKIGREGIEAYAEQMNAAHPTAPVRWSVGPGVNEAGEKVEHQLKVTWKRTGMKAW